MSARKAAMVTYRCCWLVFVALVLAGLFAEPLVPFGLTFVPAAAAILIGLLMGRRSAEDLAKDRPAVEVGPPVTGRWTAVNSPADKVPSHGTHGYGQTYAIDIVAEPEEGGRPALPVAVARRPAATATSRPSTPRSSRWRTARSCTRATASATTSAGTPALPWRI